MPNRKYEIAPRFLKLQNQTKNNSSQELMFSSANNSLTLLNNGSDLIPPPRASVRPLPSKPLKVDNSRAAQLDALECASK